MILENLLHGWAGTDQKSDTGIMDPRDFVRMCEETRTIPVTGVVVHIVDGRRLTLMPLRNGTTPGKTLFTSQAFARRLRAS